MQFTMALTLMACRQKEDMQRHALSSKEQPVLDIYFITFLVIFIETVRLESPCASILLRIVF